MGGEGWWVVGCWGVREQHAGDQVWHMLRTVLQGHWLRGVLTNWRLLEGPQGGDEEGSYLWAQLGDVIPWAGGKHWWVLRWGVTWPEFSALTSEQGTEWRGHMERVRRPVRRLWVAQASLGVDLIIRWPRLWALHCFYKGFSKCLAIFESVSHSVVWTHGM